jgi:hypothetical protein
MRKISQTILVVFDKRQIRRVPEQFSRLLEKPVDMLRLSPGRISGKPV